MGRWFYGNISPSSQCSSAHEKNRTPGSNRFYNALLEYPNCQDNLQRQMAGRGIRLKHVPCPWNLFEHALVGQDYAFADEASAAAPGDYVALESLEDLILVCSACPSRVGRISGDIPRGAAFDILQDS